MCLFNLVNNWLRVCSVVIFKLLNGLFKISNLGCLISVWISISFCVLLVDRLWNVLFILLLKLNVFMSSLSNLVLMLWLFLLVKIMFLIVFSGVRLLIILFWFLFSLLVNNCFCLLGDIIVICVKLLVNWFCLICE